MRRHGRAMRTTIGALVFAAVAPPAVRAQGDYEIEVYSTELVPVKSLVLELHSNYTFRGREPSGASNHAPIIDDMWLAALAPGVSAAAACTRAPTPFFQRGPSPEGKALAVDLAGAVGASACAAQATNTYATHETIEAVTGVNSWSEIGGYLFTSEQSAPGVRLIGGSLRYKARVPGAMNWPVGVAVSTELEYDSPQFSTDTWSWEIRPVVDKAMGRWYVSLNPTLERTLQGTGVANGIEFSPSAKATFDVTALMSAGVEYYGAFGKIGSFAPPASRLQQFFAVTDLHVSPQWELNLGLGAGTTPATNHLMAKVILGRRFTWN
jgi:hypothetical protein